MRATVGQVIPAGTLMSEVAKLGVRVATDGTPFFPLHMFSEDQTRWSYEHDGTLLDWDGLDAKFTDFNPTTLTDVRVLEVW